MKPVHLIPPVAALLIAGVWIGGQRRSIAALENQSALLRKEIAARRDSGSDSAGSRSSNFGKETKDKGPMDWKIIAAKLEESRNGGGMGDMRTMMRLNQRLTSMSKDELAAALEEIAALDLPETARMMLENMLIGPLIGKDPEFALTKFIGRINDERGAMQWQLSRAFGEWAKKDPVAATTWFDRQIAAGTFESKSLDGKSQQRMQFEGAIIGTLLASNPEAASQRLAALPEDQRGQVLRNHAINSLKEEDQLAYAKLVRQSLPEKDGLECIAGLVSRLSYNSDDYSTLTACMDRIEATSVERAACVEQIADSRFVFSGRSKITRDGIEKFREWTKSQSPQLTDRATGLALANSVRSNSEANFSEMASIAADYHNASGSDEVLAPILRSEQARKDENKEQARALARKISDEKVRNEILQNLK